MRIFKKKINKKYIKNEADKITDEDVEETVKEKEKIVDKIAESGFFEKNLETIKLMIKMLVDYAKGRYREVPWLTISTLTFILIYIVNPLDVVPDFIPLIGYVDDLSVLAVAINLVQTDLHKYNEWKEEQEISQNQN